MEPIDTPDGWEEPDWSAVTPVHDWRNYVSEEVRAMWHTFHHVQQKALARNAQAIADREEWD